MTIEIRTPSVDEAAAIRALIEEHAQAAFGESDVNEQEIRTWFARPQVSIRIAERDGELAGYLDVAAESSGRFPVDIRTLDPEAAARLLEEAERMARADGASAIRAFVQGDDPVLRDVLDPVGWKPIRYSFQMRIDLGDDLPEPEWPAGLSPRNAEPGDEERAYEAHMDAFADHWDFHHISFEEWRSYNVDHNFDPSLWWLVEDDGELAAISLNSWHFSGDPHFGWIGILGVRPRWRRQGLATALLRHSFRDFRSRGATRVGLGVDGENTTGAVRLYERAGMSVARRNDAYEKMLDER
jgi:mycothiol synthase